MSNAKNQGWLLLTNDDGIQAIGMKLLVESLNRRGHKVVVFAPSNNQSATGMRINLMTPLSWRFRDDLKLEWDVEDNNLHLIELDGTPCDTMIVALDKGLNHILPDITPRLVVSGVNLGPNMSQDHTTAVPWVQQEKLVCMVCLLLHLPYHHLKKRACKRR